MFPALIHLLKVKMAAIEVTGRVWAVNAMLVPNLQDKSNNCMSTASLNDDFFFRFKSRFWCGFFLEIRVSCSSWWQTKVSLGRGRLCGKHSQTLREMVCLLMVGSIQCILRTAAPSRLLLFPLIPNSRSIMSEYILWMILLDQLWL